MRSAILAMTLMAAILTASQARAAGWGQRPTNSARVAGQPAKPIDPRRTYAYRYYQGNTMYPKYNFGIHNRQLENIGVPTGDIGLRGNGYMMNPW
jgi:hypothetical protein